MALLIIGIVVTAAGFAALAYMTFSFPKQRDRSVTSALKNYLNEKKITVSGLRDLVKGQTDAYLVKFSFSYALIILGLVIVTIHLCVR
jgi:hypothetical protein